MRDILSNIPAFQYLNGRTFKNSEISENVNFFCRRGVTIQTNEKYLTANIMVDDIFGSN